MTDDEEMSRERICCCQPCHDLLVKLDLLELNTGMLASLLSFDQLQTGESTGSPSQHTQDGPRPVLPDYMLMTERPATSMERMMIARHARERMMIARRARGLKSAVVQERIVDQQRPLIVDQQPAEDIHYR